MPASDRDRWIFIRRTLTGESRMDEFFGGEYDKLRKDKRVESLSVTEKGGISLKTRIIWKGNNHALYLGLHEVHIGFELFATGLVSSFNKDSMTFNILCLESGRHDGSMVLAYAQVGAPGGFCFGERKKMVLRLIKDGELFALLMLTLESLWHINEGSESSFAAQYRSVLPDGTIEPIKKKDYTEESSDCCGY